ncbi:hypothetical protein B0H66DRAFT_536524 [Apodospora peruviana]|uniref:Geranylgeranyl pyrophosphate synthetase n=1 Tax=Apodospora peruviana TaxID=516989 RepID=A0AAE0HZB5_9PEZI|nr:hypothetical protein B0H66DRAFT_536524 [Apodospora peruviana]
MASYWASKAQSYRKNSAAPTGPTRSGYGRPKPGAASSWRSNGTSPDPPATATVPPPLGKLIQTLRSTDLDPKSKEIATFATIKDVDLVTSYNWLDGKDPIPTIITPGKPPLWTPHETPQQLSEDSGTYYRDKNAARYPKHPMEPAVVAFLDTNLALPAEVNIMACGSALGNLLRFVSGQDKLFRILVQKVNNTIFFIRRENSPTEVIPDVRGYGHSFPEAYTTWERDLKGSGSHQRLIRYKFAGLYLVVRFEADGYIQPKSPTNKSNTPKGPAATDVSINDLVGALSDSKVAANLSKSTTKSLEVKAGGSIVDQKHIFDLKTRSIKTRFTKDHLAEELPRLWVTQIPTLILAYHTRGLFKHDDIQINDVSSDVQKWEKEHLSEISRLAALIHKILDLVAAAPGGKLELCHQTVGKLDVRQQLPDAGDVLSAAVKIRWEGTALGLEVFERYCPNKRTGQILTGLVGSASTEVRIDNEIGSVHTQRSVESAPTKLLQDNGKTNTNFKRDDDKEMDEGIEWDDGSEKDFTACSLECEYCGRCSY